MWPAAYWAPPYFAARYWAPVGAGPPVPPAALEIGGQWRPPARETIWRPLERPADCRPPARECTWRPLDGR